MSIKERAMDRLVKQMTEIAESMTVPEGMPGAGEPSIGSHGLPGIFSIPAGAFDKTLKLLLVDQNWKRKFSQRYLENELRKIIMRTIEEKSTSSIRGELVRLQDEYETYSESHRILLPLVGIKLLGSPFEIGKARICKWDDKWVPNEAGLRLIARAYKDKWKDKACIECNIVAESYRAVDLAKQEAQRTLRYLRYAVLAQIAESKSYKLKKQGALSSRDALPTFIGLVGDVSDDYFQSIIFPSSEPGRTSIYASMSRSADFELAESAIARMETDGVFALAEIESKQNSTEFEKIILRASKWLASAQTQVEDDIAFLNTMTCIETIFQVDKFDSITPSLSLGTALLTAVSPDDRMKLKKRMKKLYSLRSQIAHSGTSEIR